MSPAKRPAEAAAAGRRTSRKTAPAQPTLSTSLTSNHPTIKKLSEGLADPSVMAFIKAVKAPAVAAGIDALDAASYKSAMKQFKEYTCVMRANDVDILRTANPHIIPSWGTLQPGPQLPQPVVAILLS